jgi:hypothetical protein
MLQSIRRFIRPHHTASNLLSDASITLGPLFGTYKDIVQSLKVVEYVGDEAASTCYMLNTVTVKLQAYQLYDTERSLEGDPDIPQAEIALIPHLRFDGQWDEYVCRF